MTYEEACAQARSILGSMSPQWKTASCEQIRAHILADPTLFVGNDPIRLALTAGPGGGPTPGGGTTPGGGQIPSPSGDDQWSLTSSIGGIPMWAIILIAVVLFMRR